MWAVRAVLIAMVVVVVVAFAFFNVGANQTVDINLIYVKYINVPLITVVFWSFLGGLLVSLIVFIFVYIKLSVELRYSRKKVTALEHEVGILRNRPIEESADFIKDKAKPVGEPSSPFEVGEQ
jgi:uncharacterized integral membrane protein